MRIKKQESNESKSLSVNFVGKESNVILKYISKILAVCIPTNSRLVYLFPTLLPEFDVTRFFNDSCSNWGDPLQFPF